MTLVRRSLLGLLVAAVASLLLLTACSEEHPAAPAAGTVGTTDLSADLDQDYFDEDLEIITQVGSTPPPEQATVALGDDTLPFWPYTGTTYDGSPMDPVNLVFAKEADPLQIRAALLELDGDRTAFGFPDEPPFNERWLDALGGDVQTAFAATGHGWVGSVIQLTLGDFGPLRFHLRLFRTGNGCGAGCWTLGGAHFEMQIPGTTDHQVLSWELAEQLVVADLMRTGLLDADLPMMPTGPINAAPSFRDIPPEIYNMLPPELVAIVGGPEPPVSEPVPLASDGQGTILNVTGSATVAPELRSASTTIVFEQMIPRPYCSEGPGDWLWVTGPVDMAIDTEITAELRYRSWYEYSGQLAVQAYDMSSGDPIPVGDPFVARVSGTQLGGLSSTGARIYAIDRRFTREAVGPQFLVEELNCPQRGFKTYRSQVQCLD